MLPVLGDQVAVFSKNASTLTLYTIEDGKILKSDIRTVSITEIINKNEIETELGYSKEMLETAMGTTFENVGADVLIVDVGTGTNMPIVFKSNYEITTMLDEWFVLDTTYQLPNEYIE